MKLDIVYTLIDDMIEDCRGKAAAAVNDLDGFDFHEHLARWQALSDLKFKLRMCELKGGE